MANIPSERDLIDPRIDVHAQRALRRLFAGDVGARTDASEMLSAVKAGTLAGIYIVNQRVPALRLQQLGTGWWRAIPPNRDTVVVLDPANLATGAPLVAFRDGVKSNASRLDPALREAWSIARRFGRGEYARCDLGPAPQRRVEGTIPGVCAPPRENPCMKPTTESTCSRYGPGPEDSIVRPWICRLDVTFRWVEPPSVPKIWIDNRGTGVLVGPRHVLTAAHVLHVREKHFGNNAPSVQATPGDIRIFPGDDDRWPVKEITASNVRVSTLWSAFIANASEPPSSADYGLITLEKPLPPSHAPRWKFPPLPLRPPWPMRTGGYAQCCFDGSCDVRRQTYRTGTVLGGQVPPLVNVRFPSAKGHSGSPVWTTENGQAVLRGLVVTRLGLSCSQAIDLASGAWNEISAWIDADNRAHRTFRLYGQSNAASSRRR